MKIKDAQYAGNIYNKLKKMPEIAFIGRSNVGKSSLINALVQRKTLVQTSKTPGKTRNINFFQVDFMDHPSLYMVDLPGYGYAKVSKDMKIDWQTIIEKYFFGKRDLKLAIIIVDIRRGIEEEELQIINMLENAGIRYAIAATKVDRANSSQKQKGASAIQTACGKKPIVCASPLRQGVPGLWKEIVFALKG